MRRAQLACTSVCACVREGGGVEVEGVCARGKGTFTRWNFVHDGVEI